MQNATISILMRTTSESSGEVQIAEPEADGNRGGFAEFMQEPADNTGTLLGISDQEVKKEAREAEQVPVGLRPDMTSTMTPQGWISVNISDQPLAEDSVGSTEGTRPPPSVPNEEILVLSPSLAPISSLPFRGGGDNLVQADNGGATRSKQDLQQTIASAAISPGKLQASSKATGWPQRTDASIVTPSPEAKPSETPGSVNATNTTSLREARSIGSLEIASPANPSGSNTGLLDVGLQSFTQMRELQPSSTNTFLPTQAGFKSLSLAQTQPKAVPVPSQNTESPKAERILTAPTGSMAQENPLQAASGEGKSADKFTAPLPATGAAVTPQQSAHRVLSPSLAPISSLPFRGGGDNLVQADNGGATRSKQDLQQTIASAAISPGKLQASSKATGWPQRTDASIVTPSPEAKPSETPGSVNATNTTSLREARSIGSLEIASPANPSGSNTGLLDVGLQSFTQMRELQPSSTNTSLPTQAGNGPPDQPLARHVAQQLANIAHNPPSGPVGLTLSPEELGRVHLMFKNDNGSLTVSLTIERPETLDLMRRHIDTLTQELRSIGYREVNIGFGQERAGQGGVHSGPQQQADNTPPPDHLESGASDAKTQPAMVSASLVGASTGIDIRL